MADRSPGTHVLRFLLHPEHLAKGRIGPHEPSVRIDRERIELFEARHRDGRRLGTFLVAGEVVVHLPRADDEARDVVPPDTGVIDHGLERSVREVG